MECGKVKSFDLDTKGNCFFCLKQIDADDENWSETFTFKFFARYLNLDIRQVYDIPSSIPFKSPVLENPDIVVPVCGECESFVEEFSSLYEELDLVKLRLNDCVRKIHDVMMGAEEGIRSFRNRILKKVTAENLINIGIIENLRKEAIAKSSSRLKRASPQVMVTNLAKSNRTEKKKDGFCVAESKLMDKEVILSHTANRKSVALLSSPAATYKALPNGKFQCNLCRKCVSCNRRFYHTRIHQGIKPFPCPHCSYEFRSSSDLSRHISFKHREAYLKAYQDSRLSDDTFKTLVNTVLDNFECPSKDVCCYCNKIEKFRNPFRAMSHMISKHREKFVPLVKDAQSKYISENKEGLVFPEGEPKKNPPRPPPKNVVTVTTCSCCGLSFSSESMCTNHSFRTHRAWLFSEYKNIHESDLSFEERIKMSMKEFFDEDQSLDGTRKKKCQLCKKTFGRVHSLRVHIAQHHFDNLAHKLKIPVEVDCEASPKNMADDEDEVMEVDPLASPVDSRIETTEETEDGVTIDNFLYDTIMTMTSSGNAETANLSENPQFVQPIILKREEDPM